MTADPLLQVIHRLYAAVTQPEQWPAALAAMSDLIGGDHALVVAPDGEGGRAPFVASAGIAENHLACVLAQAPERALMPGPLAAAALPVGITTRDALWPDPDFGRSAYYNEIIRPMRGYHAVFGRQVSASAGYIVGVCRSPRAGNFNEMETGRLGALLPHLTTAVELHGRLHAGEARCNDFLRLLHQLDTAVILTDAAGRIAFVNRRAERLLTEADGLASDGTSLRAATHAATQRLRAAIARADAPLDGNGRLRDLDAGGGRQHMRLERSSDRAPLLLTLLPASRLDAAVAGGRAPRVAIFVKEPDAPVAIDAAAISDLFQLTAAETAFACEIAKCDGVQAAAERLGISPATARTHLARIFHKTGTNRQAALVRLLLAAG